MIIYNFETGQNVQLTSYMTVPSSEMKLVFDPTLAAAHWEEVSSWWLYACGVGVGFVELFIEPS